MLDNQKFHQLYKIALFFNPEANAHVLIRLFRGPSLNSAAFHPSVLKILNSRYHGTCSSLHELHNVVAIHRKKKRTIVRKRLSACKDHN